MRVYNDFIDAQERQEHYCVAYAINDAMEVALQGTQRMKTVISSNGALFISTISDIRSITVDSALYCSIVQTYNSITLSQFLGFPSGHDMHTKTCVHVICLEVKGRVQQEDFVSRKDGDS
ncbi:hypothetical protein JHK87_025996 [Glycine soja]|nr:hypothetical protein JHK87_025996 [Glycine soja]